MKPNRFFTTLVIAVFTSAAVYGHGNDSPQGFAGDYNGSITTGGGYDPYTGNAKRVIEDIVVPGSVGAYPLKWTRILNTRGHVFEVGGTWRHSYAWEIAIITPAPRPPHCPPYDGPIAIVNMPDGRVIEWMADGSDNTQESPEGLNFALVPVTVAGVAGHDFLLTDGGKVRFRNTAFTRTGQAGQFYAELAREIVDPYGQITTLEYESYVGANQIPKLLKVKEPGGRYLQINYLGSVPAPIGSVQAFDGRGNLLETVTYTYTTPVSGFIEPYLTHVAYANGTVANYTYEPTFYRSQFSTCDDVRFAGPMRYIEYEYALGQGVGGGQVKAEKNANHQVVSEVWYPPVTSQGNPDQYLRTETRGDGATRKFDYEGGSPLKSFTDFKNQKTTMSEQWFGLLSQDYPTSYRVRTTTDARGKQTKRIFRIWTNALQKIVYHDNTFVTFEYSNADYPYFLKARTDERGNRTEHLRDANNRITRTNYPPDEDGVQPFETFEYNAFSQIVKHRLTNGAYEHFEYDTRGLLMKKWSPTLNPTPLAGDDKTTYTYYASGPWIDRVESETDPRGNVTFYEYDRTFDGSGQMTTTPAAGRGLVTKIRFPNDTHGGAYASGTSRSYGFNKWGDKVWEENEKAERTTYTYDIYGRVTSVKDPINPPATSTYGAGSAAEKLTANVPDTITSPMGIVTTNVYDENLRKTSTTTKGSDGTLPATTTFEYDEVGNPTKVIDPLNHATTTTYDDRNRKETVKDALNHVTTFGYDDAGNVETITRPDMNVLNPETKTYDKLNRVLTNSVPVDNIAANNLITKWKYNPSGTVLSVTDPKNQKTTFEYDAADSKKKMIYPVVAPAVADYEEWTYDGNKNLVARRTVNGAVQNFGYDARNRKENMWWTSDGSVPNFTADSANFKYDKAGHLNSAINPTSSIVRDYDAAGRMLFDEQILPPPPPVMPVTVVSRKTHGAAGDFDINLPLSGMVAVEPRSGASGHKIVLTFAHAISYTGAPSITAGTGTIDSTTTSPDGTQVTLNLSGVADAQTIVVTLAGVTDGTVVNNVSVGMALLLGDVSGDGTVTGSDKSLCQAQAGAPVSAANFLNDVNLTGSITGVDVNTIAAHKGTELPAASPLAQTPPANRQVYVRYEYDADGKQKRLSVDGAEYDRTFTYDAIGRFEKIKNTVGGAELFQYVYDTASNETQRRNLINGVDQIYTRDVLNRMERRDLKKAGSVFSYEAYGFDVMSRLASVTREDNKRDAFTYDYSSQLTSANYGLTYNGTTWVNPARPVSYTWDKAGNRDQVVDNGATNSYTTTILNQYLMAGASVVTNGSEHEISEYQGKSYRYVNDERLAKISSAADTYEMVYDALGRCVKRTLNGVITYYVYDGEKPILEYNNVYQRVAANLYGKGIDEILMRTDYTVTPNVTTYYQDDHEGSVTHLTDGSGNVIERYKYDAFGAPTIYEPSPSLVTRPSSLFGNRFLFTGREYAEKFGVYEYRNRAYHPGLGRFTSEDPMGFAAGDNNLFRYCGNDPVDRVDPTGTIALLTPWAQAMLWQGGGPGAVSEQIKKIEAANNDGGSVSLSLIADIRRPDPQAGEKMNQTVTVKANGTWSETHKTGSTNTGRVDWPGLPKYFADVTPVKGTPNAYNVSMKGYSVSTPLMAATAPFLGLAAPALLSIHYSFRGTVNFSSHTASLGGWHSRYPSFSGQIAGRTVFDRFQSWPPLIGLLPGLEVRDHGQTRF
jgi:RHS repeat-associated protein